MKSKIVAVVLTSLLMAKGYSQSTSLHLRSLKPELFATTGIGLSIPNTSFKQISKNGYKTYTGIEFQLVNQYWVRLSYELNLYGFENVNIQNGFKINSNGNRTFLGGFIDVGYRQEFHDFAVYGYGGFGVGGLNSPNTTINPVNLEVNSEPLKKIHTVLRTGIGVEIELRPRLIPFIEYQYGSLLEKTKLNGRNLSFSNIIIGFKARLKRQN
jgi:hypothetical protein